MTTTSTFFMVAGNIARNTVTFEPESPGVVALADVSCRYVTRAGATGTLVVAQDAVNVFHVDVTIPDAEPRGWWQLRWESNSPSPKIALEDHTTRLNIEPSVLPTP